MSRELVGRVALVTGATAGIGKGIAIALAQSGARVVATGRDGQRGAALVEAIRGAGGYADFVPADLAGGPGAVADLAAAARRSAGADFDILVNNAARLIDPRPTADLDSLLITDALAVNVAAPMLLTAALVPAMLGRGEGVIVNVGSINGIVGMAHAALYSATKAAIHSLTRSWAAEFAGRGVRVNTVAPGPTATEFNLGRQELLAPVLARVPSGQMTEPADVGAAVVFLASPAAANIHGATLTMDGAFSAV
jgi:NAD(P)-dependent dehydrogenase (short-subunit alcohol dehydrogenase family)